MSKGIKRSANRLALLKLMLEEEGLQAGPASTIPKRQPSERRPLSFAQERLWFLDQLDPNLPAYNLFGAFSIEGQLDIIALEKSINEIVQRHEVLRTTFVMENGQPVQRIAPTLPWQLTQIDLSHFSESKRKEEVPRLARQEAHKPFALDKEPLLRTTLLYLDAQNQVIFCTMHHIISDGWSMGVFVRELTALYEAFSAGKPSSLPELEIQYADFAVWQRQWLQGEVLEEQVSYWKKQLADAPPILELPTDRVRPAVQTFNGATYHFALPPALAQALKALSQQEDTTLFMTLLAAFKVLLYRYTAQEDILVGSPIANRNRAEIEGLIGFFVNTLVLRTSLTPQLTFRDLLAQVRQVTLDAYAHQDLPFEKLVEALQPERSLSHQPLFQVMFALQNAPMPVLRPAGLRWRLLDVAPKTAKFDLMLSMQESEEGLTGHFEYNTDLFDAESMARMLTHFQTVLNAIVATPDRCMRDFSLVTEAERRQLLIEWNKTHVDYPEELCLHTWFEARAKQIPDETALLFKTEKVTYHELNRRANQVAHYLRALGVRSEVLVGICVERSVDMLVGILAILKAGGAYVPLDPAYPQKRLDFMLADTQAPILVTQQGISIPQPGHALQIVYLDTDWERIAQESEQELCGETTVENLAYVLYTSGSTGRPKGVAITHRNVFALLSWAKGVFSPETLKGVLAATSICFDLSVYELFLPLTQGGTVILAENALHLPDLPAREAVTLINTVPSAIAELVRIGRIPDSVRVVNLAGEPLKRALVQQVYEQTQASRVYNLYGPSEDTTYSTFAKIDRMDSAEPTIGRPISNTQAYILDSDMQPVPVGVYGELYLGGQGLARYYLNRPKLTAERFVPNPFSHQRGERLYKTGDLVRYQPNGQIQFIGRLDHQVKIRGYRIELGEIELVLERHIAVQETVVVAHQSFSGNKQLVAYVVPKQQHPLTPNELRGFLAKQLPQYMIPTAFFILDKMPLTPNGKINRQALPSPEKEQANQPRVLVTPRTPTEEILTSIWKDVLNIKTISVNDDFFTIGGHSLLATQIISRVRQTFQVDIPLRSIFDFSTVARLAAHLDIASRKGKGLTIPPIVPVAHDNDLPLSFAQQRLWFLDQLEQNSSSYNIPTAVRLTGQVNIEALQKSINEVIRRHEALRTTFAMRDRQAVQIIAPTMELKLEILDLQPLAKDEQTAQLRSLMVKEAHFPFDLTQGPLLRMFLIQLAPEEYVLLLVMHHIVSDGWSINIFIREIVALYQAFSQGLPSPLPELPIQYADFAVWQRQWLQGPVLEYQLDYWQQQLGPELPVLNLPTDWPRPPVLTFNGAIQKFTWPKTLTDALVHLSQQASTTLFVTLMSGFKALLHDYTQQDDIVVGTDIANRHHREIEGLIGFFVNQLVLRTNLSGDLSFLALLERVNQVALEAYTYQDLPFEKLVETLNPKRELNRTPLFQVKMVLQAPMEPLNLPSLRVSPIDIDHETTKFDLLLNIWQTNQGLSGLITYSTDLFKATTITRILEQFEFVLQTVVQQPDITLNALRTRLSEDDKRRKMAQKKKLASTSLQRLKKIKPKTVTIRKEKA